MRSLAIALLALTLTCAYARATPTTPCTLHDGDRIVLFSAGDDPHVLVWDSRFRLRDYHAAIIVTFSYAWIPFINSHASLTTRP